MRPEFVGPEEPAQLEVAGARHPVLDVVMEGRFVPNDVSLRGDGERCQVITGPNMGGKSCFIRSCALIAIAAQVGSFVPADSARLHALDAVHTRMGANDNIALGRSTFLEELRWAVRGGERLGGGGTLRWRPLRVPSSRGLVASRLRFCFRASG